MGEVFRNSGSWRSKPIGRIKAISKTQGGLGLRGSSKLQEEANLRDAMNSVSASPQNKNSNINTE